MEKIQYEQAMRLRPKNWKKSIWSFHVSMAILNKRWANNTIKNNPDWFRNASYASIKMISKYLYFSVSDLAMQSYDYSRYRTVALDRYEFNQWQQLKVSKYV